MEADSFWWRKRIWARYIGGDPNRLGSASKRREGTQISGERESAPRGARPSAVGVKPFGSAKLSKATPVTTTYADIGPQTMATLLSTDANALSLPADPCLSIRCALAPVITNKFHSTSRRGRLHCRPNSVARV